MIPASQTGSPIRDLSSYLITPSSVMYPIPFVKSFVRISEYEKPRGSNRYNGNSLFSRVLLPLGQLVINGHLVGEMPSRLDITLVSDRTGNDDTEKMTKNGFL